MKRARRKSQGSFKIEYEFFLKIMSFGFLICIMQAPSDGIIQSEYSVFSGGYPIEQYIILSISNLQAFNPPVCHIE